MSGKIKVTICTGTACYVMGGSELLLLEEMLPESLRSRVEICASECLGVCHRPGEGRPPYVRIGETVMSSADPLKVIAFLQKEIG